MSKRTRTSIKASADRLWSHLIRVKANGRCERCGETGRLEAHHIHGRTDFRLRFEPRNGMALCHQDHRWAEQHPLEFADWFREVRPADYEFLKEERAKGLFGPRTLADYLSLEASLKAQLDEAFPCEAA